MEKVRQIAAKFLPIPLRDICVSEIGHGLINATYLITDKSVNQDYILQKINNAVFKDVDALSHNTNSVIAFLQQSDYPLEVSLPVPTQRNKPLFLDDNNDPWRMFTYIKDSVSLIKADSPALAFEAAKAFSQFYKVMNSPSCDIELQPVLPDFINFEKRISDYKRTLETASEERKTASASVVQFVNDHLELPNAWIDLQKNNLLPKRIIHADPKISNVLFHETKREAIAVIDLDTVMEGTLLYDFGDMIRSYTNITDDESTISVQTNFDPELFAAAKKGFLSSLETVLEPIEKENLDYAAKVVVFIQAIRFLTDYLNGDTYYHVSYENHNLYRTVNQINLLKGILTFC
ncbi:MULTISPECIES: phosphotransferase enzyme family protein [Flavobacterium]|uniref:phosphotransferase enzyme family protein n=1 Tax=Flavobacterium TaxID=237 RepID=UPI001FCA5A1D|nr:MULTISPECIES: aminoglycoside phosphotransferase family protein [Flavobacterium]UOK43674.1 aminoglycoside phosphotransferase family protein [Flavobacterium enshiense]